MSTETLTPPPAQVKSAIETVSRNLNAPADKSKMGNIFRNAANKEEGNETKLVTPEKNTAIPEKKEVETSAPEKSILDYVKPPKKEEAQDTNPKPTEPAKPEAAKSQEENFAALRKAKEEAESKLALYEKQIKEIQSKIPTDYDRIKQEHEQLVKEIEKVSIEKSPRFQEKYDKKIDSTIKTIQKALGNTDADIEKFINTVKMPDSKDRTRNIAEQMGDMDEFSKGRIAAAITEYDNLREARNAELSNPEQTFQQLQRLQQQEQEALTARNNAIMDNLLADAPKQVEWLTKREGADEWNKHIDEIHQNAKMLWSNPQPPENLAKAALAAAMYPKVEMILAAALKQNEELQGELAKLKGAKPNLRAGVSVSGETAQTPVNGAIAAFRKATGR